MCIAVVACETPGDVVATSGDSEQVASAPPVWLPSPVPRPSVPTPAGKPASEAVVSPAAPDLRNKPRPAEHVVRSGEDIYQIAAMYGLDAYVLATSNGLSPPFTVSAGQSLKLPPTEPQYAVAQTSQTATAGGGDAATVGPSAQPGASQNDGSGDLAAAVPVPKAPAPSDGAQEEGFLWPVSGDVISAFGPKGNGLFNDGINIAAARGAPVRAAEGGVVAYAGNELRGFGNMILIKHPDGWVTAYAHAEELIVAKGERVSKGQVIARVGSTGNVDAPQLHFEMRKGKKAVDPLRYLRRSAA
jgi:Membrane proteins related to metalloendopeptidases